MLQLPMTPIGTFKLVLEIHEDKGYNRIEMLPRPQLDLQGKPNLIIYQAIDSNSKILATLAHEGKEWVEFDARRHRPENFLKPKPEALKSEVTLESTPVVEPTPKA